MNKIQIKKCYPYILYKLEHSLDLSNQQISNISFLRDLLILNDLNLETNFISDISPLQSLTNLESIYLSHNPISRYQIDELKKVLPNCVIYYYRYYY
jgi:Leucine-rich repeat (LRR) protein